MNSQCFCINERVVQKMRKKKGDPFFHKGQLIAGDVEWTGVGQAGERKGGAAPKSHIETSDLHISLRV